VIRKIRKIGREVIQKTLKDIKTKRTKRGAGAETKVSPIFYSREQRQEVSFQT